MNYASDEEEEEDGITSRVRLAEACSRGDYEQAQQLMASGLDPVTSRAGYFNWCPLHYTAKQGKLDFARVLISQYDCNPMVEDKEGRTPLHIACQHGQLEYVRYLVEEKRCDVHYGDVEDLMPLYHACGWLSECTDEQTLAIARFLVLEAKCDPNIRDCNGKNGVLHASEKGFVSVLKFFIEECGCDVSIVDYRENNALHLAVSFSNNFNVVKYLLSLGKLDSCATNNKANSLFHMVAIANSDLDICRLIVKAMDPHTLQTLVVAKNFKDETPLDLAKSDFLRYMLSRNEVKDDNYYRKYLSSLGLKQPGSEAIKLVVLGDQNAGKSTLVKSLQKETSSFSSSFSLSFSHSQSTSPTVKQQHQDDILAVSDHKSKFFGEVQFYDLSGSLQAQYVHEAVLPYVFQPHACVFLLVVDFSKPSRDIDTSLTHWLGFIGRIAKQKSQKAKVILIASHSDVVKTEIKFQDSRSPREKLKQLILKDDSLDYEIVFRVLLDCQKSESSGINMLRKQITGQCEDIRGVDGKLSFLTSCLLAFIKRSFDTTSLVSLKSLIAAVDSYVVEKGTVYDLRYFVSEDPRVLCSLLENLCEHGHLYFTKNETDIDKSLIIPSISQLCSDLSEAIHGSHKSNSQRNAHHGLLTPSNFESGFFEHNPHDVLQALSHLKLAITHADMSSRLAMISAEDHQLYYCPSLLYNGPPKNIWDIKSTYSLHFGWVMEREDGSHSPLSLHFIHTLFLNLFSYVTSLSRVKHFTGWEHGLHFECFLNGMEFLFEFSKDCSALTFIMRSKDLTATSIKCRATLIQIVRDSFRDYYANGQHKELVMDPYNSQRYPVLPRECLTLFSSEQILRSIQSGRRNASSSDDVSMSVEELLTFEPLWSISGESLTLLLSSRQAGVVSSDFMLCLSDDITCDKSKLLGEMLQPATIPDHHLNHHHPNLPLDGGSDHTYQGIIQLLKNFTIFDFSLIFCQKSNHSPQYLNCFT